MRIPSSLLLVACLALPVHLVGCGDDATTDDNNGGGGGGGGTNEPGPGPANEVDAEISGGSVAGPVDGESEQSAEGTNFATLNQGRLDVYLSSGTGIVFFTVNASSSELPGSVSLDGDLLGSGFLSITTPMGILEGRSGSITVSQCPNDPGVITGTFNNIPLTNAITSAADGTFSGSWRATVVNSDASATCAEPEPEQDAGNDTGGGGGSCDLSNCDGPCCPYLQPIATCQTGCVTSPACLDPFDPSGCIQCLDDCVTESGVYEDAACNEAYRAFAACEESNGCSELEDAQYESCVETNCCDETAAAF